MAVVSTTSFSLIPLRDVVVFPQMVQHCSSAGPNDCCLEQALLRDDRLVVLVAQKDPECENPKEEDIYQLGTLAEVMQMLKLPDGTVKALVEGSCRVTLDKIVDDAEHFSAVVTTQEETNQEDESTKTLVRVAVEKFEQYVKTTKRSIRKVCLLFQVSDSPGGLPISSLPIWVSIWPSARSAWKSSMPPSVWNLSASFCRVNLEFADWNSKYTIASASIWKKRSANTICAKRSESFKMN